MRIETQINLLIFTLRELQQDNSRDGKQAIIKNNLDNELFVEVMQFLLNPFVLTGISKKKINKKVIEFGVSCIPRDLLDIMSYLKSNSTGKDLDIFIVQTFLSQVDQDNRDFISDILTKSLKLGVDSLWNKTVSDELKVPEFGCMLAKSYYDNMDKVKGEFVLTKKLDGNRCVIIKDSRNGIKALTRTGKEYEGLETLLDELNSISVDGFVLDGELIADIEGTTAEQFSETQSLARSKGKNKVGLKLHVFDIIGVVEFYDIKGIGRFIKAIERKKRIHDFMTEFKDNLPSFQEVVPLYIGSDISMIEKLMTEYVEPNKFEGLMINLDEPYSTIRTSAILKVKKFKTCDVKIIGFEEGDGRLNGTLGRVNIDFKGFKVGVGSGFSDEDRKYFWDNQDTLLGRVIEVKYSEVSTNKKDDSLSLRFPTFVRLREEDKEVSYN